MGDEGRPAKNELLVVVEAAGEGAARPFMPFEGVRWCMLLRVKGDGGAMLEVGVGIGVF